MSELIKEIQIGRILKINGSWMYCDKCNKTVGYLCYSTYQDFRFDFACTCGNSGSFRLQYPSDIEVTKSYEGLKTIKNRLCCPKDDSPLCTIVEKNVERVSYVIVCKQCKTEYSNGSH